MSKKRVTVTDLRRMKADGERITMVTAYDATFAKLADRGGADVILVGDSLGMVIQGQEDTLGVTVDDIVYHTRAVVRGAQRAHVVADMPFMSYQADLQAAMQNAGRLLKEGGAQSVKLEGGEEHAELVFKLVRSGIPVMGHLGLTPQSVHAMGGFKVQGKSRDQAEQILRDAQALEAAGAYAIVLEGVPVELSRVITEALSIPTIGIGAGVDCDGQVLVIYDLLGLFDEFVPKFVKQFAKLGPDAVAAIGAYKEEVQAGTFPAEAHTFHAKEVLFRPRPVQVHPDPQDHGEDGMDGLYGVVPV
ncbi:MAG: 3-methyl-2-oxobutanoate hydroxymethyltransferase [Deltaproteobacteria bacterium]|nr:3-methyl-2-oxobutanoate hydroxymethyltransferase [Deltaproteobacteria bacterium]